jgi:hypothetical protein
MGVASVLRLMPDAGALELGVLGLEALESSIKAGGGVALESLG